MTRMKTGLAGMVAMVAWAAGPAIAASADATKDYPSRPVRFIVPFAPGAGTDTTARTIAAKLAELWKYPVVAENRPSGAGVVGMETTRTAVPDGYTICLISASSAVSAATNPRLPYDLTRDLQGITQATSLFYAMYMHPSVPATSVKEFITYAKANPGKLNYGTSGIGGLQHLAAELFDYMAGTRMVHVPYKGTGDVIPAMLSNQVQVGFGTLFGVRPHMQTGRLRAIAITAAKRSPAAPELPTIAEAGVPGYSVDQWYGVITSAKVPAAIVNKLNVSIREVLKRPDVVQRFAADGSATVGSSPAEFNAHIKTEVAKWAKLAKEAKLDLQ
jgi:tripartite-type tricarboxylate transporter receptor subunit TctC